MCFVYLIIFLSLSSTLNFFNRIDRQEYVLNTFSFGYAFGYHFLESSTGACNGNFLGIGADLCTNASVVVEGSVNTH